MAEVKFSIHIIDTINFHKPPVKLLAKTICEKSGRVSNSTHSTLQEEQLLTSHTSFSLTPAKLNKFTEANIQTYIYIKR